jgi:Amt family ammonium transporter
MLAVAAPVYAAGAQSEITGLSTGQLLGLALSWLLPIGVALIGLAAVPTSRAVPTGARMVVMAAISVIGYWLVGFGLHFGGVGLAVKTQALSLLTREWSLFDVSLGPGWGMFGLTGFMPGSGSAPLIILGLLAWQVPWVATGAVLLALAWNSAARGWARLLAAAFLGAVLYPVFGNWTQGGGWLAGLATSFALGHGFVDPGATLLFLLPGLLGAGGILLLRRLPVDDQRPAQLPPVHLPLLALSGLALMGIGLAAALFSNPLVATASFGLERAGANLALGAFAAALGASIYGWFATGKSDLLLAVRGGASGLAAMAVLAPFVPVWAALLVGFVTGVLFPLFLYLFERSAGLDDRAGTIATFVIGPIWGLLALGIFADGLAGAGWNGVGAERFLNVPGLGVTGLLSNLGILAGWQSQLYAQLVGIGAAIALALVAPWLVGRIALLVSAKPAVTPEREEPLEEPELGSIERKAGPPLR